MLHLKIQENEFFDENTQQFVIIPSQVITLEHSLISVSKWEAKHRKSFFRGLDNNDELMDYIKCMTITSKVNPLVYESLNTSQLKTIEKYINDPMTATTFRENNHRPRRNRVITSELIYCWMFSQNIPIECEKWHLNRLMTLIRVCSIENNPKQGRKMSRREIYSQNSALNAARRAKYGTRG